MVVAVVVVVVVVVSISVMIQIQMSSLSVISFNKIGSYRARSFGFQSSLTFN